MTRCFVVKHLRLYFVTKTKCACKAKTQCLPLRIQEFSICLYPETNYNKADVNAQRFLIQVRQFGAKYTGG